MSNEYGFFLYLLEKYAEYRNVSTADLLTKLDETNLTEYVMQMYPMYHTERIENAFADMDKKLIFTSDKKRAADGINFLFDKEKAI